MKKIILLDGDGIINRKKKKLEDQGLTIEIISSNSLKK